MTNEQLAQFIQQGGNDELLPLLWDRTRLLIYKKCNRLWRFYSEKLTRHGYSFEDLEQESYNALLLAVKAFKAEKEYKFTTYLNYALKRVVRGLLSGADILNQTSTQSLEQPLAEDQSGGVLLVGDTIADERAAAAYEEIERRGEYRALYAAVDALPWVQREVIIEHYFKGLTRKQIAEIHSCTELEVRSLLQKALRNLRSGETGEKLWKIYGEDRGAYGVRHKGLAAFKSSGTSEIEDYVYRRLNATPRNIVPDARE